MAKVLSKYESESGSIHPIRLQKALAGDFANTVPAGAVDSPIKVKISKSNRAFGIRPRGLRLKQTISFTAPSARDVTVYSFLPILSKSVFDGNTAAVGATVKVGGVDWIVADKVAEDY